jgi:outer membrane protein, heavy metal efflux system
LNPELNLNWFVNLNRTKESGAEGAAVQTPARLPLNFRRREASGLRRVHRRFSSALILLVTSLVLAGCKGIPVKGEHAAQRNLKSVGDAYRPKNQKPALPMLAPDSSLSNFLAYALLNQPRVEAAYYDWAASVQRITVERSLPDPKLTFEADIADVLMEVMLGFMQDLPGPGKLKARGAVATAESQGKYFTFENAVLQAAFDLKRAYYELGFLDERLRINRQTLSLLNDLERIARAQNETGRATLQDVLRAQIERDRVTTEIANIEDSRRPMLAAFKAALGLTLEQSDPPSPARLETTDSSPDAEELLRVAFERNPRLKAMEADVRAAQAGISMAYKERVPDFSVGLEGEVTTTPTLFKPQATMTLPIWRDKLAAQVAQAKAQEMAARSRLSAEQIQLAVEFAEKSFAYREINRNLSLFQNQLIPKGRQSLEIARGGYLSGSIDFFNLIDAQRMLLDFEMSAVEARKEREVVLAELTLLIAGVPPPGAPLLKPVASEGVYKFDPLQTTH